MPARALVPAPRGCTWPIARHPSSPGCADSFARGGQHLLFRLREDVQALRRELRTFQTHIVLDARSLCPSTGPEVVTVVRLDRTDFLTAPQREDLRLRLRRLAAFAGAPRTIPRRLFIVSDMLQHTTELSQYNGAPDFPHFRDTAYYRQVFTDLDGVAVTILYLRRSGQHARQGTGPELRPLRSTGVPRLRHYYGPIRHPRRPDLPLPGVG